MIWQKTQSCSEMPEEYRRGEARLALDGGPGTPGPYDRIDENGRVADLAPYGSWRSPIGAELVAAGQVALSQVQVAGDDVYWIELRPKEKGRNVVVRRTARGQVEDVTPPGFNARNMVQEYGGGDYAVAGGS